MEDAGVFFDSRDVVEKEDMVQIFVNSGRIVFRRKEGEGEGQGDDDLDDDDHDDDNHDDNNHDDNNHDDSNQQGSSASNDQNRASASASRGKKERNVDPYGNVYDGDDSLDDEIVDSTKRARIEEDPFVDNADANFNVGESSSTLDATAIPAPSPLSASPELDNGVDAGDGNMEVEEIDESMDTEENGNSALGSAGPDHEDGDGAIPSPEVSSQAEASMASQSDRHDNEDHGGSSSPDPIEATVTSRPAAAAATATAAATADQSPPTAPLPVQPETSASFASRSIGELRQLADSLSVDISACIEKREIVELIVTAISNGSTPEATSSWYR